MRAVYRGKGTPSQKKFVFGIPVLAVVLLLIVFLPTFGTSSQTSENGTPVYFTVRPGMSVSEIGKELHERGVIDSETKFWLTAKLNGFENKVKSGTFALHTDMTPRDALETLVYGNTVVIRFVIPEGFSVRDIAARLEDEGMAKADDFIALAKDYRPYPYVEAHEGVRYAAEGFLFPDTYEINGSFDANKIMEMMAENFDRRLTQEMRDRAREMNLSVYELVTLASLVEKEAYHEEDRPIIAQIFLKRPCSISLMRRRKICSIAIPRLTLLTIPIKISACRPDRLRTPERHHSWQCCIPPTRIICILLQTATAIITMRRIMRIISRWLNRCDDDRSAEANG